MTQAVMMTATCSAHSEQQQQHMVFPEMHASWCAETESCVCIECTKVQNAVSITAMLGSVAMCDDDDQGCPERAKCYIHGCCK